MLYIGCMYVGNKPAPCSQTDFIALNAFQALCPDYSEMSYILKTYQNVRLYKTSLLIYTRLCTTLYFRLNFAAKLFLVFFVLFLMDIKRTSAGQYIGKVSTVLTPCGHYEHCFPLTSPGFARGICILLIDFPYRVTVYKYTFLRCTSKLSQLRWFFGISAFTSDLWASSSILIFLYRRILCQFAVVDNKYESYRPWYNK
jgi:hypothetical protein